jgi:hypothetical protein
LEVPVLARLQHHLSFANVVSLMALFVALSGGAYALAIPRHSVGAPQLKRDAVTRAKIKHGAVTSSKVRDRSLGAADFRPGQLPAGRTGDPGPKGDSGAPGTARAYAIVDTSDCPGNSCRLVHAKNISSVQRFETGIYCVAASFPIDTNRDIVMAGVDFRASNNPEASGRAMTDADNVRCKASGRLDVETFREDAAANNTYSTADDVSFWVAIP